MEMYFQNISAMAATISRCLVFADTDYISFTAEKLASRENVVDRV